MYKNLLNLLVLAVLLPSCNGTAPHISVVCEENNVGNCIVKWEMAPLIKGNVKVYASTNPNHIPEGKKLTPVQLTGVKMQEYFETLLAQMERSTVDSMVTTGLALHEMLALCARGILAQAEATSARQVILQAAETLRKNYQQELCLADLLAEAHMSKSYFLRLFRRYMGTTPYNYLVNFRITQAKELLVLTDHSVSEIAQEVGFGDASNFSTRFAKATGQSPLQYRKSALKSAEER